MARGRFLPGSLGLLLAGRLLGRKRAYARVFGTEEGKAVLADILREANVGGTVRGADHHATLVNAGRLELANTILARINLTEAEAVALARQQRPEDWETYHVHETAYDDEDLG